MMIIHYDITYAFMNYAFVINSARLSHDNDYLFLYWLYDNQ